MLSHGSILHNCEGAFEILGPELNDIENVLFYRGSHCHIHMSIHYSFIIYIQVTRFTMQKV